jgi:hypothetical protein
MLAEVLAFRQRETGEPLCGSNRRSARRRHLRLSISLNCWVWVSNCLSMKCFHGVLVGNVHECSLIISIGKARRSLLPHEGQAGTMVPRGPAGRALREGSSQRILEGRQRRVSTPARGGAGVARWSGAGHAGCPARHPVLRPPCGTVPHSPMSGHARGPEGA